MLTLMIRESTDKDFDEILAVINDGATAYRDVIPPDCYHEPYMSKQDLRSALREGISFWVKENDGLMGGIMGIQNVDDVTLIRHAYVRTSQQRHGVGSKLLSHLLRLADRPVLVGTWRAADWAIQFYRRHGFEMLSQDHTPEILQRYWSISERQIETSVVLAQRSWLKASGYEA